MSKLIVDTEAVDVPAELKALAAELGVELVRAKIQACRTCLHFACVCAILAEHDEECRFRRAATCSVQITCNTHDHDVCPTCDPCTCKPMPKELP